MPDRRIFIAALLAALLPLAAPAEAGTLAGVEMPDTVEVDGRPLKLNGMGLRLASAFKVKVYVAGFYLEQRTTDATLAVESVQRKRVVMHFLRDVKRKDLQRGWQDGFRKNVSDPDAVADPLRRLVNATRDVKKGQRLTIDFVGAEVRVRQDDETLLTVESLAFQHALLSTWFGPSPPNPELKAGMLGLK